ITLYEKQGASLLDRQVRTITEDASLNEKYTHYVQKCSYLKDCLNKRLFSDREYRNFFIVTRTLAQQNSNVETYNFSPTKLTTLLVSFQMRANDTLYFASYDTRTQQIYITMNVEEIKTYLRNNLNTLIITDYIASIQLQAILNDVEIRYMEVSELRKQLEQLPKLITLHIDSITNLLDTTARPDFVEWECHNVMRVNVSRNEGANCLQHLENIKYLFDTRLREGVSARHLTTIEARRRGVDSRCTLSQLADILLYNGRKSNYRFNVIDLLKQSNVITNAKVNAFLLDVHDSVECNIFSDLGIDLTIGKSGYGGLRGCIKDYYNPKGTKIVCFDFSSFYPTILLDLNNSICQVINFGEFKGLYDKKFSADTPQMAKTFYKILINTAIGVLGSSKNKFKMKSRDTWKAIIKIGQLTMLNLLYSLEQQGAKILHVNTDGCYVEVPETQQLHVEHKYPIHIEEFSHIYIKGINDYMVGNSDRVICKGKYKYMDCTFVKNLVIAKQLFHKTYEEVDYQLEDCYLYSSIKDSRYIHFTCGFNDYEVDTRTLTYLEEYKLKYPDKDIQIDTQSYYAIADYYIN
ncbi:MAG: hypothetical protein J6F30_04160, partial [Cellulosilyticum sp.]|nr:hypothetical protein [Cellulosilyticum sp.]